ncbi:integrator complex subunit 12 isoform X1 [Synchiropus splendidus]|uniref:integrator complex subunit 12 isoform X1 n=1 Tax=Synchiropus splendidus TaxID=270530 RepID=UPI00237E2229|nr:integrator complex subunit 12 isoform X1 [Synchiropus splendidus]
MAGPVSLELDPIFLKGLSYLHSKNKDSAEKLKALLDESMSRGSDSTYRSLQKDIDLPKSSVSKLSLSKQEPKTYPGPATSSGTANKSSSEKVKKEAEKRSSEKSSFSSVQVRVDVGDVDPPKKPRLEKQENRSSPITVQTSKDLMAHINDYDETNADDFAMEMGLACVVCRQMTVTMGNQLVECQECHNLYHQDCHKPQVTDKEVNDPRLVWYCARCTRQMKRMAQKPPQKPSPVSASSAPVVKDTLVKKTELKAKPDTASTFQAFKRTEVKTSTTSSNPTSGNSSSSGSGLTGWAAFGAKTNSALPATSKLGSSGPSGGGKPMAASSGQKPVGLSGLAGSKSGLGAAKVPGNGNGSGTSQVTLKPPPPLTLGKQQLSRSSSSETQGKVSTSSGGGSPGSSHSSGGGNGGNGNGGGNGNNGNGSKGQQGEKAHESQLNAMKRLHMVKKKAAQKKLKK